MSSSNVAQTRVTIEDDCYENLIDKNGPNKGRYQHRPLNKAKKEIRLIRILNRFTFEDFLFTPAGLRESEEDADFRVDNERTFVIKAAIEEYLLDSAPPYIALSYMWGDMAVKRPVFIPEDPKDPKCRRLYLFEVTENLFQALRQLQPMEGISHIWADAICINQADNDEKSWQVQQMWDIYKSSQYVVLWMGVGNAATNKLMDMMVEAMSQETDRLLAEGVSSLDALRIPESFTMLEEFDRLALKGYWTRAWIRQEISSHESDQLLLVYGRRTIEFRVLQYLTRAFEKTAVEIEQIGIARRTLRQHEIQRVVAFRSFKIMSDALKSSLSGEKAHIIHILYIWLRNIYVWGLGLKATDPRDLIYSLLSMTNWREQDGPRIYPDYAIGAREVYINMAKKWPNICTWRNDPNDNLAGFEDLNLPSWVPDWRRPFEQVHLLKLSPWKGTAEGTYWAGSMFAYKGGWDIKPTKYSEDTSGRSFVHMEGFVVDKIAGLTPTMPLEGNNTTQGTCRKYIAELNRLVGKGDVDSLPQGLSSLSLSTAQTRHALVSQNNMWQLPILNVGVVDGWLKKAPETYERAYEFLARPSSPSPAVMRFESKADPNIPRYAALAVEACHKKRFFVSKSGLLGIAFRNVQINDLIVVFPGLKVPLILREYDGEKYRIISDTYVQGIMDGETEDSVGPGKFQLKDFAIF